MPGMSEMRQEIKMPQITVAKSAASVIVLKSWGKREAVGYLTIASVSSTSPPKPLAAPSQ